MLKKLKQILNLNPKGVDDALKVSVGIVNNKLTIHLDRSVSTITFTKEQVSQFLSAIASNMGALK